MEVVQGTLEVRLRVNIGIEAVEGSLWSNNYIVREAFLFEKVHRGAVLIVKYILCVVFFNHCVRVGQLTQVVLECLRPLIITVVGKNIVEIEVSVRTVECDVLLVEDCAGVGNVADCTDFLSVHVEFDGGVVSGTTLDTDARRLDNNADGVLLSTLEGASYLCGRTVLTEHHYLIATDIEASAGIGVVALHQLGFAVLDVVGGKGELKCHTIGALGGCCAEGCVCNGGFDILGDAEAHFVEVLNEAVGGPVGTDNAHRIAVVADGVVGLGIGAA